ncbi:MAG: hypothetical protein LBH41_00775 [Rickettsiales bacterium]|jgi:hypothetical protein|nr:hypothetical protein [Rickettsiales bacterium]
MRRLFLFLVSSSAIAAPARLEGWSYRRNEVGLGIRDETVEFNDAYDDPAEPAQKPYLDEDGNDARLGIRPGGDKYAMPPVYSLQTLYDINSGKIADPFGDGGLDGGADYDEDDDDDGGDDGDGEDDEEEDEEDSGEDDAEDEE